MKYAIVFDSKTGNTAQIATVIRNTLKQERCVSFGSKLPQEDVDVVFLGSWCDKGGLSDLMNTVRIVRRSLNPKLELEGVLLTMFDGRTNLALQVAEEVKHYFPGKVYATVIPRNVRLSEAPSHGKPITAYDRSSRGAEAYTAFAAEFLKRQGA